MDENKERTGNIRKDERETNCADNFVSIKSEVAFESEVKIEKTVLDLEDIKIKLEPIDYEEETISNSMEYLPVTTTIKIEPSYENETEPQSNVKPVLRPRKRKESSDEEYIVPHRMDKKKSKNKPNNVKPGLKGKPRKNTDMIYTEEITKHVEIVTITEEERKVEHSELVKARRHMRYLCEWCALGFVLNDAYQDHMKMHNHEAGEFECDICHTRLKSSEVLYRHRLRHYRRYRCSLCGLRLRDKDTAAAHVMKDHHGSSFLCLHCEKSFKRPQYLKRHIQQMHTRAVEFVCPVCKRVFYERGWYRCHVRSHNEEVRKVTAQRVPCTQCERVFKSKTHLQRHMLTHDTVPAACRHCGRTFKNVEVLRVHCRQQHSDSAAFRGDEETECVMCGRVCATPSMLHRHLQRMHADRTKRFECDHCGRRYLTKGEVRSHIMWSHMRRRGGHVCACGRVFRSPARLRQHRQRQHLRLPEPRDKECNICGKTFANQQVLTRHIRGHSGETYPCSECGQTFKTQSYVKVHYKIKHLNMTRAQVKAQSKRKLLMADDLDEGMDATVRAARAAKDPLDVAAVVVKEEALDDIEIPKFELFIDVKRAFET